MPVMSWGHVQYWEGSDTSVAPVVVSRPGGYPAWQSTVILGSGWGACQSWWERLTYAWGWLRRAWAWGPQERRQAEYALHTWMTAPRDHQIVLQQVAATLQHPGWPQAKAAVRATATTLGFNKPQAWAKLGHELKQHPAWAENSWRHLNAMHLLTQTAESTLTNPQRNLLTELGYVWFGATKGRE